MVKKQYFKSTLRLFLKHIIRLLSISAIFVVSIGLMDGIGVVKGNVKGFVNDSYSINNVYDIKIMGLSSDLGEIAKKIGGEERSKYHINDIEYSYTYDYSDGNDYAKRVTYVNLTDYKINKLTLLEGQLPKVVDFTSSDIQEVAVLESSTEIKEHKINDLIELPYLLETKKYKIVGIVREPTILGKAREPSNVFKDDANPDKGMKSLNDGFFINVGNDPEFELTTALTITLDKNIRDSFNSLSDKYLTQVNLIRDLINNVAKGLPLIGSVAVLTLNECFSYTSLITYANKVGVLAIIFVVFFSLITLLVVFSTMSRLLDEDRGSMAVLKTLGYSNFTISMRYVLFMLVAGVIGTIVALFPAAIVNKMIINGFMMQYKLTAVGSNVFGPVFFVCGGVVLLLSLLLTFGSAIGSAAHKPVELLTPKAPKVGKKILLERIKSIWTRLSFKYKSTCRNVFLFKGRFFMTFFSIIASTTIVFASLALFDNSFKMTLPGISALRIISLVLLIFSAILCALVVYNITNINISERRREIATLMVLGYRDREITGYIYREIYIMAILSSLVGLPCGIGFTAFVFKFMELGPLGGTIGNINWWTYIITPILTCLFAYLATLLLRRNILKTNMNDSLKVLE